MVNSRSPVQGNVVQRVFSHSVATKLNFGSSEGITGEKDRTKVPESKESKAENGNSNTGSNPTSLEGSDFTRLGGDGDGGGRIRRSRRATVFGDDGRGVGAGNAHDMIGSERDIGTLVTILFGNFVVIENLQCDVVAEIKALILEKIFAIQTHSTSGRRFNSGQSDRIGHIR